MPSSTVSRLRRGASSSATRTITVTDSSRPTALLSQATFTPQVADNVAVTSVQWSVDGALRLTATTAPFAFTLDLTGLSAGAHSFRRSPRPVVVFAKDGFSETYISVDHIPAAWQGCFTNLFSFP